MAQLRRFFMVISLGICTMFLQCFPVASASSNGSADDVSKETATPALLLVSIDGFRHDYFEKTKLPTLSRLINGGLKADSLQQIFPTKTFATHYSMATGLYADRSGVVANNMWDPVRRATFSLGNRSEVTNGNWYDGEPIWNTVQKAGKKAATYSWPGSEAEIGGMRPHIWVPFDGSTPHDDRIAQVLAWLDMPSDERPDFLTLYFSLVDKIGHIHGPDHPKLVLALQEIDRTLGLLVDELQKRNLLNNIHMLITSDHGMQNIDKKRYIILDNFLDLSKVMVSDMSPVAHIWTINGGLTSDEIFDSLHQAHPNLRVWKKADVPPRYHFSHHERVPDIVAEADLGWMISNNANYNKLNSDHLTGMHGWDPAWLNMHGIFIAHGPAFAAMSKMPAARGIDLYSLMSALMQIEPAANDGKLNAFEPLLYAAAPSTITTTNWTCDSTQIVLREGVASASLQEAGRVFSLLLEESQTGKRYQDTDVLFWHLGKTAQVMIDGLNIKNCRLALNQKL
jgi:predicted AlkP superfamily pyrophosphatase or phosphodiesterase